MKLLASAALLLATVACGGEYGQSSIDPKTDVAEAIQELYLTVFIWTMIVLVVVWGLLVYVLVRFRERPGAAKPKQTRGDLGLELAWTIAPAIIVVAIAIPTIQTVFSTQRGDPENSLVVEVVGHQYWWEFRYPDGIVTAGELHLPVGQPIALRLQSADVIHSFWVPQLGGKRDVNPAVAKPDGGAPDPNWLYFTIEEPGVFMGQCAEFCGDSHALMGVRVVAESAEDFAAWGEEWRSNPSLAGEQQAVDSTAAGAPGLPLDALPAGLDAAVVEEGRQIFHQSFCIGCHKIEGTNAVGVLGPNLTALGLRGTIASGWLENSVENLEAWIRSPRSIKPGALMPGVSEGVGAFPGTGLTDPQLTAVAQYLLSLR